MARKKKILVADDSFINQKLLFHILSEEYEVLCADDEAKATEILERHTQDLRAILLDLVMPSMNGLGFIQKVRADNRYRTLPIIVITQSGSEDVELRALEFGASDFLSKPYRPAIIRQRLANLVGFYEAARQRSALEKDGLTGLYNRTAFFVQMEELRQVSPQLIYEIVTVDIDRFQLINELFGTEAGDALLKRVAAELAAEAEKLNGLCGRFFADEFVLFGEYKQGWAEDFSERLQKKLAESELPLSLTARIGTYTLHRDDEVTAAAAYDRAKIALSTVKGRFGKLCGRYSEEDHRRRTQASQIESDMKDSLERGEFEVYFQPKYDLTTGTIDGAEALLRWNHPSQGFLKPDAFLSLFEKNGFIGVIDEWLWNKVCSWIRHRKSAGLSLVPVSVNMSRIDLYNPELTNILAQMLKTYQITPEWLELEITETAYTENPDQLISVVQKLKEMGFAVQMDDFGSGYSSLNMLAQVPVDALKLDMRFLQSSADQSRNVLNFVISLAKWMNLSVVAEGIETKEQAAFLGSMGCNHGQGYYFSSPLRQAQFEQLLDANAVQDVGNKENMFSGNVEISQIWNPLSQFNLLFNSYVGALAVFEYIPSKLFLVRGNENYYKLSGCGRDALYLDGVDEMEKIHPEDSGFVKKCLDALLLQEEEQSGDIRRMISAKEYIWLHLRCRVIYREAKRILLLISLENCTEQKQFAAQAEHQRIFLANTYDTVPCGIAQFAPKHNFPIISANANMLQMLGISREEFNSRSFELKEFVDGIGMQKLTLAARQLFETKELSRCNIEYQLHSKKGESIWVNDVTQLVTTEQGDVVFQSVYMDITEKKEKERELRLIQQQFLIAVSHANNQVFTYFPKERKVQVFDAVGEGKLFLRTIENGFENYMQEAFVLPESKKDFENFLLKIDEGEAQGRVEVRVQKQDRSGPREVWYEGRFYRQPQEEAASPEVVCVFTDISDMKKKELGLYQAAHCDPLTGLYNRARFVQLVEQALYAPHQQEFAFVMIDLDNFKVINDSYGHAFGDDVLCVVAAALRGVLRENDVIARLGGDEFALMLSGVSDGKVALRRMEGVRKAIAAEGEKKLKTEILASVGAALAPVHGTSFAEVYRNADTALYAAKNSGKHCCRLWNQDMPAQTALKQTKCDGTVTERFKKE